MRTDCRRPASADFAGAVSLAQLCLFVFGACFVAGASAADNTPAVIPPKPVVLQPTATMAPPAPPVAVENAPQAAAKSARKAQAVKKATPGKFVAKPRPKAKPARR